MTRPGLAAFGLVLILAGATAAETVPFDRVEKRVRVGGDGNAVAEYLYTARVRDEAHAGRLREFPYAGVRSDGVSGEVRIDRGENPAGAQKQSFEGMPSLEALGAGTVLQVRVVVPSFGEFGDEIFTDTVRFGVGKEQFYELRFPQEREFWWNDGVATGRHRGSQFSRSHRGGPGVLHVSTVGSWEEFAGMLARRYRAVGEGRSPAPGMVPVDRNGAESIDAVVARIMAYVRTRIEPVQDSRDGHRFLPASPEEVLRSGRGDCKDLSYLAASMLRRAGVDATVVLVGSAPTLDDVPPLPVPGLLKHAVVAVRVGPETAYFDPMAPSGEGKIIPGFPRLELWES